MATTRYQGIRLRIERPAKGRGRWPTELSGRKRGPGLVARWLTALRRLFDGGVRL